MRYIPSLDRGAERDEQRRSGVSVEDVGARTDAVHLGDDATIIYTSGTTGKPKVSSTHGNFISLMPRPTDFLPLLINGPEVSFPCCPRSHTTVCFVMYRLLPGQGVVAFLRHAIFVNDIAVPPTISSTRRGEGL